MPAGRSPSIAALPIVARGILEGTRRAVLTTVTRDYRPHAVPVCFALRASGEIVTPIDDKPKRGDKLQRVINLENNPNAMVLFDHWDEDWERLGWVQVRGKARFDPAGSADEELAERYEQYAERAPSGDIIVIVPEVISWWTYS